MIKRLKAILTLVGLLACPLARAQVDLVCPEPPNRINVRVDAKVTLDPLTRLYTYEYTVDSRQTSALEVSDFALFFSPQISDIKSPRGWSSLFFGDLSDNPTRDPSVIGWNASEHPPMDPDRPNFIPPGLFQIKPGTSLSGFSFTSPNPPGPVRYYAQGFMQLPGGADEMEAESLEACPPESVGDFFETSVMGTTVGPVSSIPIRVDIKPETGTNAINPRAQGLIPVVILGSAEFDVNTVDVASLRFGPAGASEAHGQGHYEDVNADGKLDLVLHFETQQSGIRCSDTAAFLIGTNVSGQKLQGADSFVTVGCEPTTSSTSVP